MQFKLPTDTNALGAGITSEQRTDTSSSSTPSSSTLAPNQQILPETGTQASPDTHPSDSYWGQLLVQKSAEANAHKVENDELTAKTNELKAELEGVKRELRRAKIKIVMDEKARERAAEKLQKANEKIEAARKKIASIEEANTDWVLDLYTTRHELQKANAETISAQRARAALEKELEDTKVGQAALEKELENTNLAQAALGKELELKKRELCKSQAEKSLQGELHETTKKRLLAVEDMLYASRRTSTTVASELYVTKQMLQDANDEISAGASAQAALQTELEDTKGKLSKAVMEKKSSEVERTLLNSSLAIVKLHLSTCRVNATLSACMAEKDALKRQLSDQSATVETAVSQVVDKIAALGHSVEGRLSAFENSVKSTIGELHNGVQSNGELMEGLRLQLSKAEASTGVLEATTAEQSKQCVESSPEELKDQETSMPASLKLRFHKAVEESNRLTQSGSVAEDADAAIQKGRHEVREILRDYLTTSWRK